MAKKKAARPTAATAKRAAKKAAQKRSASGSRPAARKAKKAPARKSRKPAASKTASVRRPAARKGGKKAAKKAPTATARGKKAASKASGRKKTAKKAPAARTAAGKASRAASKAAPAATRAKKAKSKAPSGAARKSSAARPTASPALKRIANLDRPRRTVADIHGVPSSLDLDRTASAVRSGRAELQHRMHEQTNTSPALTAGDVDADWAAAGTVGDEAPGGDNPTPDQDVVEEIGRALGVEYDDDEELQGGNEIAARDRHRWELDPESSDDFEER
jgi:hypothetical protein